jgi:hypothetical protein
MVARIICAVVLLLGAAAIGRGQGRDSEMGSAGDSIILNALDVDESGKLEISEINAGLLIAAFPKRFSFVTPPGQRFRGVGQRRASQDDDAVILPASSS